MRELTGFEVLIGVPGFAAQAYGPMCIRRTKHRGADPYAIRLAYVIDEKQLTKE
jgi:hypothetical protein